MQILLFVRRVADECRSRRHPQITEMINLAYYNMYDSPETAPIDDEGENCDETQHCNCDQGDDPAFWFACC